jgi:hypothetical protein
MANILLTWEMGGGAGHCSKLAPIAQRLVVAGHTVSVVARDIRTAQRFFGSLPLNQYQAPSANVKIANRVPWPRTLPQILYNTRFGDDGQLASLVGRWRDLFDLTRPNVVVCDYSPTALLASRWHGHQRVILGTGFEIPPPITPLPNLEYWCAGEIRISDLAATECSVLNRANRLLQRDGLAVLDKFADLFMDVDLSFLLTFKELDHYPERLEASYRGTWSFGSGELPRWPKSKGPRVFAYLRPARPGWNLAGLLSILRTQRMSTLVYVPGAEAGWLRKFESPTLRVSYKLLDLGQLAQQCDAAILHAGAGTVAEFLLRGVPLVNIPLQLEQLVTAHRVDDMGAGLIAPAPNPAMIVDQLKQLLDTPIYANSAAAFSRKYADFDSNRTIERVVRKIVELL